jgi:uncharacterized protein (DUF1501 family)
MSKKDFDLSRREFLLKSTLLSASSVASPFALNLFSMNAAIASTYTSDYKALVCLYLAGGNDHNNTVIATDSPSMIGYLAARSIGGGASIALPQANLLAISPTTPKVDSRYGASATRSFALHPAMAPLQTLFNAGRAAIVANVGPLIRPITDYTTFRTNSSYRPQNLFSHSDQTVQWQSTDTTKKNYGWGGRMADLIKSSNTSPQFSCLSLSGNSAFLAGETLNQYQINSNGVPVAISGFNNLFGSGTNPLQTIATTPSSGNLFEIAHTDVVNRAISAQTDLSNVMTLTAAPVVPAPTQYTNPNTGILQNNSLATQFQTVARIIAGRNTLSAHRQVFFIAIGGFDTHDGQAPAQADLWARISHALAYFDTTLTTLADTSGGGNTDMRNFVTTFTASDFGRTFTSNGDGTDHGWGSHHFVVGGAVKGKEIYTHADGFPMTAVTGTIRDAATNTKFDNSLDVGSGNFIPQISVDEYSATLAKWFGLTPAEVLAVFPYLNTYGTPDLGFMV